MIELRLAKVVTIGSLALLALLVTFNNVTDYGSNFAFVQHVLSMDTTFPVNALMYRAITAPLAWHVAYVAIILAEGLTGLALAVGAATMLRRLRAPAAAFRAAKRWAVLGAVL